MGLSEKIISIDELVQAAGGRTQFGEGDGLGSDSSVATEPDPNDRVQSVEIVSGSIRHRPIAAIMYGLKGELGEQAPFSKLSPGIKAILARHKTLRETNSDSEAREHIAGIVADHILTHPESKEVVRMFERDELRKALVNQIAERLK